MQPAKTAAKKAKIVIDLTAPVQDHVLAAADFQKFLAEHIKVANKTNNLGDAVKVDLEGSKVTITTSIAFPKVSFASLNYDMSHRKPRYENQ